MTVLTATDIANYAPVGNAVLRFIVSGPALSVDPETLNQLPSIEQLEYLGAVKIQQPTEKSNEGVNVNEYQIQGRLLYPTMLDPRISAGTEAVAFINNYKGKFRLTVNINEDSAYYNVLGQPIAGTLTVTANTNTEVYEPTTIVYDGDFL